MTNRSITSCVARTVLALAMTAGITAPALGLGDLKIIAQTGDVAPGMDGTLESVFIPVLNEAGQIAFSGNTSSANNTLYRATTDAMELIVDGQQAPAGLSDVIGVGAHTAPAINNRGQIAFDADILAGDNPRGLFRADGSTVHEIVRTGAQTPGNLDAYEAFSLPLLNNQGDLAWRADLASDDFMPSPTEPLESPAGVYRYRQGGDEIVRLASTNRNYAENGQRFLQFKNPQSLNDDGQVLFITRFEGQVEFASLMRGSGVFDSDNPLPIALQDQIVPSGGAEFSEFFEASMDNTGDVSFGASELPIEPGFANAGVWVFGNQVAPLAVEERPGFGATPWSNIAPAAGRNDLNQSVFFGVTDSGAGGLMLLDPARAGGELQAIAPLDQLGGFGDPNGVPQAVALSDGGHVAFYTEFVSSSSGIFMVDTRTDPNTNLLFKVARVGDAMLGSTITELEFVNANDPTRRIDLKRYPDAERTGLNKRGQVAFRYELADGRSGIALWSPPRLERVVDGGFSLGLHHWQTEGDGEAIAVDLDEAGRAIELAPGSPVTITQDVSTPDAPFDLVFDYRFGSAAGVLEVLLDGEALRTLDGADLGDMQNFDTLSLRLDEHMDQADVPLAFRFDGPTGANVQIDSVSLRAVPDPTSLAMLAVIFAGLFTRPLPRRDV